MFYPKMCFSGMDHHTALKLVPLWSSHLKSSECTKIGPLNTENLRNGALKLVWIIRPLNTKKSDILAQKVFFSEMDHHTALKLVPLWSSHLKTSECTTFGPLNTKKSDMLTQNVFFSEMDHHTALKLVPLWSSDLKTSECTEFGPLTIKESDILAPKSVLFQKWMIIQLWNLYHCDHHTSKPQGILSFIL